MKYLVSIILLICLIDMPYGYYQFVRFITAVYFGYELLRTDNPQNKPILVILILLFQPFLKVSLGRTIWNIVDVGVAIWLIFVYKSSDKNISKDQ